MNNVLLFLAACFLIIFVIFCWKNGGYDDSKDSDYFDGEP